MVGASLGVGLYANMGTWAIKERLNMCLTSLALEALLAATWAGIPNSHALQARLQKLNHTRFGAGDASLKYTDLFQLLKQRGRQGWKSDHIGQNLGSNKTQSSS